MKSKAYVRVTEMFITLADPIEIIAGVELSRILTVTSQYDSLRALMRRALTPSVLRNYSDSALAASVELAIQGHYPQGTSYFIEVGRGNLDQYVQVFQP